MELKWLEDLLVLLEGKSISRATARRHVTQPACSRRLRLLEQWLGVELVARVTGPERPCAGALALEDEVRDLVNRFCALRNRVHTSHACVTLVAQHGEAALDIPQYYRDTPDAARIAGIIAGEEGSR